MTVIGSRSGPDHMGIVGRLIIAVAGYGFCFVDVASGRHSAIELPQCFIGRPAGLVEGDGQIDAMILNALEAADGLTENHPLAGIFVGEFKNLLTAPHLISAKN